MQNSKSNNRRRLLTVSEILAVALAGLFMVNTEPVSADRSFEYNAAQASDPTDNAALGTSTQSSLTSAMVKMISALAVVVICVYVGLYLLKKLTGKRSGPALKSDVLEVLQTTHLGPRKTISLIKVGNRSVLVGVTEQQISTITELDPEETEEILAVEPAAEVKTDVFAGVLKSATSRIKSFGLTRKRTALET